MGKEVHYVYTENEMESFKAKHKLGHIEVVEESEASAEEEEGEETETSKKTKTPKTSIQRYKGLGEMNAEELWETTMDPARRVLKQVSVSDVVSADKVFDVLMGTDVPARKTFIQSNATKAKLDI
jgi:DNA gyrase subunit B